MYMVSCPAPKKILDQGKPDSRGIYASFKTYRILYLDGIDRKFYGWEKGYKYGKIGNLLNRQNNIDLR
jgi:hypothetical protein